MGLTDALSIANSGLYANEYALNVAAQNIANAGTAGYVKEDTTLSASTSAGVGTGVRVGATALDTNDALQNMLYGKNADVASYTTLSNTLSALSPLQGTTSSDTSATTDTLTDDLTTLENAFTALSATPDDSTAQGTVISDAQNLAANISTLSQAYQAERQTAEDTTAATVATVNTDLTTIGSLSTQIISLKAQHIDTADLENQRAGVMSDLSSQLSVSFSTTTTGDVLVKTADGTALPTRPTTNSVTLPSSTWPLSTSDTPLTAGSDAPAISLNGTDVTTSLTGGTLGANIQLRDTILPKMQAQMDSFSYSLASRFDAQGLTLFTDGDGNMPASAPTTTTPAGIVGLSSTLQVNPQIIANPSEIVSGTNAGDSDSVIADVLSYTFGTQLADGSTQPAAPTSGLGPGGTLSTGYSGAQSLGSLATALTAQQASVIAGATTSLTTASSVQTTLQAKVASISGVNTDDELSSIVTLQNAYAANAKVVSAVQSMFSSLIDAI